MKRNPTLIDAISEREFKKSEIGDLIYIKLPDSDPRLMAYEGQIDGKESFRTLEGDIGSWRSHLRYLQFARTGSLNPEQGIGTVFFNHLYMDYIPYDRAIRGVA